MEHNLIVILFFTISFCIHNGISIQDSPEKIRSACLDVSEVDESKLKQAREGTYVDDDQVSAYFHCYFINMDFVAFAAEDVNKQAILEKLPISDKAKLKDVVDSCISNMKKEINKRAYELYTCFVKEFGAIENFA